MADDGPTCSIERLTDVEAEAPTLIEGFPGTGLVASIAVDQITDQLGLAHHGNIVSPDFPPVATFSEGRVRDLVRIYAGADPDVMTLQCDIPMPPYAYRALTECVLERLADSFSRAIFLVGAPAGDQSDVGTVHGVAADDRTEEELRKAGIELAQGAGLIGGITGALLNAAYQHDIPAAALVVQSDPRMPDPAAARAVIEDALEPLVDFDIDTTRLEDQAAQIQKQKQQIAEQMREMARQDQPDEPGSAMYR